MPLYSSDWPFGFFWGGGGAEGRVLLFIPVPKISSYLSDSSLISSLDCPLTRIFSLTLSWLFSFCV